MYIKGWLGQYRLNLSPYLMDNLFMGLTWRYTYGSCGTASLYNKNEFVHVPIRIKK